jgi:hypothetical protein
MMACTTIHIGLADESNYGLVVKRKKSEKG